jgi:ATP-binding cassette subfamily B protein
MSTYSELKICIEKYDEIMNYQNEMKDGSINLSCFESGISLENVSFWYKDGKSETILNNVSMYIPKGSKVGLCGKSGGGKSTILKLIDRLYDPTAGSIKIDGIDIKMIKRESLTSYIGMVPQEIFIFDGTIRDNLTYYCKEKPSDAEILKFCKMCNLDDIIGKNGLDGRVGPRGITLSGGQKQRFGIVRVMLSNPDIVLLDEATSALDSDTEHDVMEYFIRSNKTVISVAHRLNTIRHCDTIFSIVDHDVSEQGSHEELMQNNGYYAAQINKYYKY